MITPLSGKPLRMTTRVRPRVIGGDDVALSKLLDQLPAVHRIGRRVVDNVKAQTDRGKRVDCIRLARKAAVTVDTSVDTVRQGANVGPGESAGLVGIGHSLVGLSRACHAGVDDRNFGVVSGIQRGNVDVNTVAERQERLLLVFVFVVQGGFARRLDDSLDNTVRDRGHLVSGVGLVLDIVVGDGRV